MTLNLQDPSLLRDRAYIGGQWLEAANGSSFAVKNPANGDVLAHVSLCGESEARRAIDTAYLAQKDWMARTAKERSSLLRKWFDQIMLHQEDLARLLTAEQGKPLAEARGEIAYGASYVEWFAEEAKRVYGDIVPAPASDKRLLVQKQPVGVVAAITPWNFPNAMLVRKIAPALAAGCSIVGKPANATPLSALAVAELADRAGIPPGVINILAGDTAAIGGELTANPLVRKLSFTGSTEVGKALLKACADTVKRTSMELGGNAPFIVFDDADLDAAVRGAIASKYRNAGQTCVCANRFLVQSGIYDEFTRRLVDAVAMMKVGAGWEEGVDIGPLIDRNAAENVAEKVNDAITKGAYCPSGNPGLASSGSFMTPIVLTGVTDSMRVFHEEIFGPVAPLVKFVSEKEAIALANGTPFGLASYLYTRDMGRLWRVSEALEYGIVGVNEGIISNEMAPFGGIKESGYGREGSKYGLDDYLDIKYVCVGGLAT